ncbi:MAG: lysophospholipid acyltransferase family protein [Muribaculaceae bacterium]|nr:lysophospholipid acyltransferase family protein [Muribaculaceae bacterium]
MKKKESLKYHFLKGTLTLLSKLPLCLLYPISSFAAWVLRDVVGYRRKVVEDNLRRAFPKASPESVKIWTQQFYRHLCDTFIESIKLLGISDKEVDRRIKVFNPEIVDQAIAEGHSVVLFLGHYGNWEWVPAIVRHFRNDAEMVQIYHPLRNKVFDRLMLKIRSRFGSESIPMANTYRRLVELQRGGNGFVAGFISDQRPAGHHTDNWTEFMGIETDYISGGEIIGNRLHCKYVYLDVEPTDRGHYNLTFKEIKPIDDGKDFPYTRSYLKLLEDTIRRNPPYWLWSHKRFSHRHDK